MGKKRSDEHEVTGPKICEAWNRQWPAGTAVTLIDDLGREIETKTRSEAWPLGHGAPVVLVEGRSGGYMLGRLIPHPPERKREYSAADEAYDNATN